MNDPAMILRYATVLCLLGSPLLQAQNISSVSYTPSNVTECDPVTFTIHGHLPMQANPDSFNIHNAGNTYTIRFCASGSGGPLISFTQPLPALGPFAPGPYTFIFNLVLNGTIVSTNSDPITVGTMVQPDPGTEIDYTVCSSDAPFTLFSHLGGTPTPGGVWRDPSNAVIANGMFVPGVSPEGYYTYNFTELSPCMSVQSQVGISYAPNNSPGTNGTVQICAGPAAPVDLFTHLGGTPYTPGVWTKNGVAHTNIYIPGTDTPGAYVYTVPGIAPCGDPHATVTVTSHPAPHAGTNGTLTVCHNDTNILLNAHISGEDTTGHWWDPDGFSVGFFGVHMNALLHSPGNFIYVVSAPTCYNDTAILSIVYSPCNIGVAEINGNVSRFELMPNPAHDQVTVEIELAHPASDITLEVLDVNGRSIHREALSSNGTLLRRTLDVSALRQGAYIARITSSEGSATRRLMLR
jgi:hypothetical protein